MLPVGRTERPGHVDLGQGSFAQWHSPPPVGIAAFWLQVRLPRDRAMTEKLLRVFPVECGVADQVPILAAHALDHRRAGSQQPGHRAVGRPTLPAGLQASRVWITARQALQAAPARRGVKKRAAKKPIIHAWFARTSWRQQRYKQFPFGAADHGKVRHGLVSIGAGFGVGELSCFLGNLNGWRIARVTARPVDRF